MWSRLLSYIAEINISGVELAIDFGESIRNANQLPLELRLFFGRFADEEIGNSPCNEIKRHNEPVILVNVFVVVVEIDNLFFLIAQRYMSEHPFDVLIGAGHDLTC